MQNPHFSATVICDSVSRRNGKRITTLQLTYPRFIHAEFMTHRVFSRNASSSRAIPVAKMIAQVRNNPAMPIHWGANQKGMQAKQQLGGDALVRAKLSWQRAAVQAAEVAELMESLGLHKQVANRILEPFQLMHVIVTATEWENFFSLRDHEDAQPEIRYLAQLMRKAMDQSVPDRLDGHEWHLPYVSDDEKHELHIGDQLKVSAARCARVSYLTHDGKNPDVEDDIALYDRLVGSEPLHASPIEHQARPALRRYDQSGNFFGWEQYRKSVEEHFASK